ncbi:class I SAM-dependent methyltransferase [Methylocaldum sp.]|uniref:class I SAM-dependent methyltransferase n=1 Tax=Methylocaldum sp. TaxID=1969727 RepID=UPI002D4B9E91|nr:class I SAM-dependent methyltransferase [Methylocaldum sp.]HYE37785.1 class I SAM-dependent methyltransferase [Methylocaldum sp.]
MNYSLHCWCGNTNLNFFSPVYLRCPACETLVFAKMPRPAALRVPDDDSGLYGREYWFSHQEHNYGYGNIITRTRTDLSERCLHWLRTVLKYKLPSGRTLELGCAHGAFVALLRQVGFDSTGLELSPWVVDFSRRTFKVPVLCGPVEEQQIEPASLDVIALMDVLEHLPDPVGTIRHCLGLLKPDGILVIQTPRYQEQKAYDEMVVRDDPFLEQLKDDEHLYLFSHNSIRDFFVRLGAEYLEFEPAIFAHYDMFLVVSRQPLNVNTQDKIDELLSSTPASRIVQALLDADDRATQLNRRLQESEADRAARLDQINELTRLLAISESDRAARLDQINELTRLLHNSQLSK